MLLRAKSPAGVRVYRIHSGTSYLYSSNPFAEYQCFFVHYKSHTFLLGILRDYVENKLKHLRRRIAPLFRQCRFTGFGRPPATPGRAFRRSLRSVTVYGDCPYGHSSYP